MRQRGVPDPQTPLPSPPPRPSPKAPTGPEPRPRHEVATCFQKYPKGLRYISFPHGPCRPNAAVRLSPLDPQIARLPEKHGGPSAAVGQGGRPPSLWCAFFSVDLPIARLPEKFPTNCSRCFFVHIN